MTATRSASASTTVRLNRSTAATSSASPQARCAAGAVSIPTRSCPLPSTALGTRLQTRPTPASSALAERPYAPADEPRPVVHQAREDLNQARAGVEHPGRVVRMGDPADAD